MTLWTQILIVTVLIAALLVCNTCAEYKEYAEPIPLSRCERNLPVIQIIPTAIIPTPRYLTAPPLDNALLPAGFKRVSRQVQPAISNRFLLNQIAALGGGGWFRQNFAHLLPFNTGRSFVNIEPKHHEHFPRTYAQPQQVSACSSQQYKQPQAQQIPAPPCGKNYIISCGLNVSPVACSSGCGGAY